jgi:uncharacterized membrane protein YphA (DoxX/SURF4 family)
MASKRMRRLVLAVRTLLALIFIAYGTLKLAGGQYNYGAYSITDRTPLGPGTVWAFYGSSPVYGRVTGLFELVPALLLLHPRLFTLGALGLFAVELNITIMDWCFNYPSVKYMVTAYTLLTAFVIWSDRGRVLNAFWKRPSS